MTDTTPDQGRTAFSHDGGDVGVLLIHGFTGAPGSLRAWAEHLAGRGLHGPAAAAARARHPLAGREPHHVRRLARRGHRRTAGTTRAAGPLWSAGCPWAAR